MAAAPPSPAWSRAGSTREILDKLVRRRGRARRGDHGQQRQDHDRPIHRRLAARRGRSTVRHNSAGANLVQGVTSLAVSYAELRGRLPDAVLVVEVDEGALPRVAPETMPRALLVTDLFRDQLDRFGEIYAVADAIESVAAALPPESALIVNADDPMVATLAEKREGRRVTFGLALKHSTDQITRAADTIRCPRCQADLKYRYVYLSPHGRLQLSEVRLRPAEAGRGRDRARRGGPRSNSLRDPDAGGQADGRYPAVGRAHRLRRRRARSRSWWGSASPLEHAADSLASVGPAFGRLEKIDADGASVFLAFAKNPTSYNTTLRALATEGEPRQLLIAASNTLVDGEDFGWLWDVDFESMAPKVERVVVSGTRADELANRLHYAGVRSGKLTVIEDRPAALDEALGHLPMSGRLVILSGYTPLIELRNEMSRRGWAGRYWAV